MKRLRAGCATGFVKNPLHLKRRFMHTAAAGGRSGLFSGCARNLFWQEAPRSSRAADLCVCLYYATLPRYHGRLWKLEGFHEGDAVQECLCSALIEVYLGARLLSFHAPLAKADGKWSCYCVKAILKKFWSWHSTVIFCTWACSGARQNLQPRSGSSLRMEVSTIVRSFVHRAAAISLSSTQHWTICYRCSADSREQGR